jgi:hypothetical protein
MHFVRSVLQPGFGVHYGSNVLQCLMDDSSPGLDLLVREAVQNSLDAAPGDAPSIRVEFNYSDLRLESLRGVLDDETVSKLMHIHGAGTTSLCIRDIGGAGLSGPRAFPPGRCEDYGNFLKLCFSVGLKQSREGSGGSWGFGKSIFYRLSHAPVMYYSRFMQDGGFAERLIFCLIENQDDSSQRIFDEGTGLAWWGDYDEAAASVVPCESGERIAGILEGLALPKYSGNETGTLIFLPCLRNGQIPRPSREAEDTAWPEWIAPRQGGGDVESYKRYTSVAIQRWYSPRMAGAQYSGGPVLQASVNGVAVGSEDDPVLPFFGLIQQLYSCASQNSIENPDLRKIVRLIPLQLRSTFADGNTSPGVLAVAKLPYGHPLLSGFSRRYPDPEVQVFNFENQDEARKHPVIAMIRKPGMIVAYRNSGEWVDDISPDPDGHFLAGVFVLRSDALLVPDYPDTVLEEYIRHREPPAHNDWADGRSPRGRQLNLIRRIKAAVAKGINREFYSRAVPPAENSISPLGDVIGRYLPRAFSLSSKAKAASRSAWVCPEHLETHRDSPGDCPVCGVPLEQARKKQQLFDTPKLTLTGLRFPAFGTITLTAEVHAGGSGNAVLELMAASEGTPVSRKAWEESIGTRFPIEIAEFKLMEYGTLNPGGSGCNWTLMNDARNGSAPPVRVTGDPGPYTVCLEFNAPRVRFKASVTLKARGQGVHPVLAIR